jgi:hypothetical protein
MFSAFSSLASNLASKVANVAGAVYDPMGAIVDRQLHNYLGDFVEDFTVAGSICGLVCVVHNVQLKKDIFTKSGMPLEVVYGRLAKLEVKVPSWSSLMANSFD